MATVVASNHLELFFVYYTERY